MSIENQSRDVDRLSDDQNANREEYTSFDSKDRKSKAPLTWIVLDLMCIVVIGLPIVLLFQIGVPFKRGFTCGDSSINKPYKESTVSNVVATVVGLVLPGVAFVVVEWWHYQSKKKRTTKGEEVGPVLYIGPLKLNYLILRLLKITCVFVFGGAINVLITDIGKYGAGRLRPHFLDVCKPDINLLNCTGEYITGDVCTGADTALTRQARLSFPSGHASFSAYTMVFLILFLQARVQVASSIFLKPLMQLIALSLALLCGISRVSDFKHHWSDVVVGLFLGALMAYLVVWQLLSWFKETKLCGKRKKHLKGVV